MPDRDAGPRAPSASRTDDPERARRLLDHLAREPRSDAFIPFDRFMELALYAEDAGFYATDRSPLGAEGDYYTAAHASPLFGQTIAAHLAAVHHALGRDRPFRVVELGPGDGTLARTVLESFGSGERLGGEIEYALVERSERLAERAYRETDAAAHRAGIPLRVRGSVGEEGPFEGVVLANEVLDAQPARRLRWTGTAWRELGVRIEAGRVVPAEAPPLPVPPPELPVPSEVGTILEISPAAEALVREVGDHLVRGAFVLFDYGMEEAELLKGHPSGTLAAVRGHRAGIDPFEAPGTADLSMFVNFGRIRYASRRAGLEEAAYCSQAEALGLWGLSARIEEAMQTAPSPAEEVRLRLSAKNLMFGFDTFRLLELAPPASAAAIRSVT